MLRAILYGGLKKLKKYPLPVEGNRTLWLDRGYITNACMAHTLLEKVVSLCKRRGFIFPGSAIYGGLANSWDYGPLGVELKKNIADWWWNRFVRQRDDMVGLDAAVLMNPRVWEASGHVANFNDALVDCKKCKARLRADHLIEAADPDAKVEGKPLDELNRIFHDVMEKKGISCPSCGEMNAFTDARTFNLLFQTSLGALEGDTSSVYLRGEIAQAMFVNFKQIADTSRKRIPFGIASQGKVFRNEITPGNFTFRTLEFDLMEFEYFVREEEWEQWFSYWLEEQKAWLFEMGFDAEKIRVREHTKDELSHYSKRTVDIEYETPFGWKEMFGLAYRGDYDLKNHMEHSGEDLRYMDPHSGEKFIPHVIEPTFGLTRLTLMALLDAYDEVEGGRTTTTQAVKDVEVVMRFHKRLAPVKAAVLPLSKKEPLASLAREIAAVLRKDSLVVQYDETGSIGRRYRRQDEIGNPYCVTVDFDSLEDKKVTVRDRDSMQQERVPYSDLSDYLAEALTS